MSANTTELFAPCYPLPVQAVASDPLAGVAVPVTRESTDRLARVDPAERVERVVLGTLLVLGLAQIAVVLGLFGPVLALAAASHFGSVNPLLVLVPTAAVAVIAMVQTLIAVAGQLSSRSKRRHSTTWQTVVLCVGGLSWFGWALANGQLLIAFIRDAMVREIPSVIFALPTLGVLYGLSVGAVVTLTLVGRLREGR